MTIEEAKARHSYKVTYKHGLLNPTVIFASSYEDARKVGLAEYRRCSGFTESVDNFPIDFVVDTVTLIEE